MKNCTKTKTRVIFMALAIFAFWGMPQQVQACDGTAVITFPASEDLGGGEYSIDIEVCIGSGGSELGWTTEFDGLNVISYAPATQTSTLGNVATGSFTGNMLNYAYPGGDPNLFGAQNTNTCFPYTVVLDGDPAGAEATFVGINCGTCAGSCATSAANTRTFVMNPPPPPPACGGTFFDAGGAGNYFDGENNTTVICPDISGEPVSITFTSFSTETCCDFLNVFDGMDNTAPSLGNFSGTAIPGPFTSTDASGCLTFVFTSDGGVTSSGWEASVMCTSAVPTLGQWGLILLALLLLNLGLISILQSRYQLAGMPGAYFQNLPVVVSMVMEDKKGMGQQFVRALLFIVALFAIAMLFFGYTLMQFDIMGTILSAGLLAFLMQIIGLEPNE